jgi:hypothetical protein
MHANSCNKRRECADGNGNGTSELDPRELLTKAAADAGFCGILRLLRFLGPPAVDRGN